MAQTVIGMFDDKAKAQQAMQQLLSSGFTERNIDISTSHASQNTNTTSSSGSSDSVSRFFSSLFGNNDEATNYTNVARRSSVLTVHAQTPEEARRAATIMDQYGTVDVEERAMQFRNGNKTSDQTGNSQTIPVIEEQMQVGKKTVETGGARLRSRIVERPVEESIRLREEHIRVEHRPVNRPATEADFANFKEGEVEMTEHAEVPVVGKEARVVEEIRMGKDVEEREETIHGTVRSTEVKVDKLNPNQTPKANLPPTAGQNPNVPPTGTRTPNMPPNQNPNQDPTQDPNRNPNINPNPKKP